MATVRPLLLGAALIAVLAVLGLCVPGWCVFLLVSAFTKGITALGLVILLRGGLLSFGQSLFYCAGAYGAGLLILWADVRDINLVVATGAIFATLLAVIIGPLLARYRGISFATLTLALSMLAYGALAKWDYVGGTDGLNFKPPTFFGYAPTSSADATYTLYLYTVVLVVILGLACRVHFRSVRGLLSLAAKDNEIRVEYMGMSVQRIVAENFIAAGLMGGIGGALNAVSIAHIDPDLAFWTTSGEFTFVAVLGGPFSVVAVFAASILIEVVRSVANLYFPNAWQMALGAFMLVVILLLPHGLSSLFHRRAKPKIAGAARQ